MKKRVSKTPVRCINIIMHLYQNYKFLLFFLPYVCSTNICQNSIYLQCLSTLHVGQNNVVFKYTCSKIYLNSISNICTFKYTCPNSMHTADKRVRIAHSVFAVRTSGVLRVYVSTLDNFGVNVQYNVLFDCNRK